MRSLAAISLEIATCEDNLRKLYVEKQAFQNACPHPEVFVTCTEDESQDSSSPGVPIYDFTLVTYSCAACEAKFYARYDKETETRPTLKDIIDGKN